MLPSLPRYIVGVEASGARSRKSNDVTAPSGVRTIMNPPPPMLPAAGSVTASANAVATAASTALPPFAITDAPASHAGADVQTTRPSFEGTPRSLLLRCGGGAARVMRTTSDTKHR
jgi:hypothetical protein